MQQVLLPSNQNILYILPAPGFFHSVFEELLILAQTLQWLHDTPHYEHIMNVPQIWTFEGTSGWQFGDSTGTVLVSISSSQEALGLQSQGLWELDADRHIRPQDGRSSGRLIGTHGLRAPWGTGSGGGSRSGNITHGLCLC